SLTKRKHDFVLFEIGRAEKPKRLGAKRAAARVTPMILRKVIIILTVIAAVLAVGHARALVNVEQIVAEKVKPILPTNGRAGGVAVAVRMNGKTDFFNYGFANLAR